MVAKTANSNSDHTFHDEPRHLAVANKVQRKDDDKVTSVGLPPDEEKLLREAIQSLKSVPYGSIVLVMHDGHLVEVTKTVRIRNPRSSTIRRDT